MTDFRSGAGVGAQTLEPLQHELQQLETTLEMPFVPGELEEWTKAVRDAWQRLEEPFRRRFEDEHPQQFTEIEEADMELEARVQELRAGDRRVLQCFHQIKQRLHRLVNRVAQAEPDEKEVVANLQKLVDEGLAFVIDTRKQEIATRTWLTEAFDRDRGPVD